MPTAVVVFTAVLAFSAGAVNGSPLDFAQLQALAFVPDAVTVAACLAITGIIVYFTRRCDDVRLRSSAAAFGMFVVACAATHLTGIGALWRPAPEFVGAIKFLTAFAALGAAVGLAGVARRAVAAQTAARLVTMAEEMIRLGHWRLDLKTNALFWSDELYRLHGVGKDFTPTLEAALDAFDPADRKRIAKLVDGARTRGIPYTIESRILVPGGTMRDIVAGGQAQRNADGTIVALIGVFQDVTELKNAERERNRLMERVALATGARNVGVWDLDVAGAALSWDPSMFTLYGLSEGGPAPSFATWRAAMHPKDRDRVVHEIEAALDGSAPFDTEFRVVWPNAEVHHTRAVATVERDAAGAAVRMVGTNWDITDVRRLGEELLAEKERLIETAEKFHAANRLAEEASRAKSEFVARMSHEIRTPMNGIIGFTTLLLDEELSPGQRRQLGHIQDAGRSLLAIINDVLDFSKIEAGKIEIDNIALSPAAVVDGALSIVRSDALAKGLALDVRVDADVPPFVVGDPIRLRQIVLNLLSNAIKFTDSGQVGIVLHCEQHAAGEMLRFEISDTGPGIALDRQHLLFQHFSQLDRSMTRQYGGTGLGLAIAKRLVEAMGGSIGVTSDVAQGSTFWFTVVLPRTTPTQTVATSVPAESIVARRILVVDDNPINQVIVEGMLRRDGHSVDIVSDGAAAVEAVATGNYDLVLMDMQMPIMNGIEATCRIRAMHEPVRDVPIVALTANAMADQVARCRVAGMNDHLAKPIDRAVLRRAVAKWSGAPVASPPVAPAPVALAADQPTFEPPVVSALSLGIAQLLDVFDGDGGAVADLLGAAMASIRADVGRLDRAATLRDAALTVEAAHRIKGTSGSICADRLLEISGAIERAAKGDPPEFAADRLAELHTTVGLAGAEVQIQSQLLRTRRRFGPPETAPVDADETDNLGHPVTGVPQPADTAGVPQPADTTVAS